MHWVRFPAISSWVCGCLVTVMTHSSVAASRLCLLQTQSRETPLKQTGEETHVPLRAVLLTSLRPARGRAPGSPFNPSSEVTSRCPLDTVGTAAHTTRLVQGGISRAHACISPWSPGDCRTLLRTHQSRDVPFSCKLGDGLTPGGSIWERGVCMSDEHLETAPLARTTDFTFFTACLSLHCLLHGRPGQPSARWRAPRRANLPPSLPPSPIPKHPRPFSPHSHQINMPRR